LRAIKICQAGPLTTVQDWGRFGYQDRGVPVSGAMDRPALRIGNILVGNRETEAGLEITLGSFQAEFLSDMAFAVTGVDHCASLNGRSVPNWSSLSAARGDLLTIDQARSGCRFYLTLAGGIEAPLVLGSKSTYLRGGFGGFHGRRLEGGDILAIGRPVGKPITELPVALLPHYSNEPLLRVILGPQEDRISEAGLASFLSQQYQVSERSDRMGCVLHGPAITHRNGADIISDGIIAGAVQVPGNGQPIVLMTDCQTIGGYVKIATVASFDLPLLAQVRPGSAVRFAAISLLDAREIYLKSEFRFRRFLEKHC
jgi:biotin-dependent carboxylase-like uncharacterized protein